MKHVVYDVKKGQEGWLKFGPSTLVALSGGEIQKLIREKRNKERLADGVPMKKKVFTPEEKERKKREKKERKMKEMMAERERARAERRKDKAATGGKKTRI